MRRAAAQSGKVMRSMQMTFLSIIIGSVANESFPTYVESHRPAEPMVSIVIGGRESEYDANRVVDIEAALSLARAFFEAGSFERGVDWSDA